MRAAAELEHHHQQWSLDEDGGEDAVVGWF